MDDFAHLVYTLTRNFPKEELYGITSQLCRASLSIVLNYTEGFARMTDKSHRNFLLISFGSLKESEYLLEFSQKENFLSKQEFDKTSSMTNEIGAMLWSTIKALDN
jgi:four helix bundle protein